MKWKSIALCLGLGGGRVCLTSSWLSNLFHIVCGGVVLECGHIMREHCLHHWARLVLKMAPIILDSYMTMSSNHQA